MSSPFTVIYEFDRFRLDRANRRLTRDGLLVGTPGKAIPLLITLIENREKVVTSEKLVNAFFPKSLFGDEEIVTEILTLKKLLDDTSKAAPMIRTVTGKGYQFEAEVTEFLGDSASDQQFGSKRSERDETPAKVAPQISGKKSPSIGIAVGAVLVAALGFGLWHFLSKSGGGRFESAAGGSQVAVLPFQSLTGAATDDNFNRSLTESLISSLGKRNLQVVPESAVQSYMAGGAADPVTAGRELGARVIVRGMAQRLAGRILVKVQLISTQDGSQIWSNGFEGDSNDMAGLSAQISEKIGKGIPAADGNEQP